MAEAICVLVEARPHRWYYVHAQLPTPHDWRRAVSARAVGPFSTASAAELHLRQVGMTVTSVVNNADFRFDSVWHDLIVNAYDPMYDEV